MSGDRAREYKLVVWTVEIGVDAGEAVIAEEFVAEGRVGVSAGSQDIVYESTADEFFFVCNAIPGYVVIEMPGIMDSPLGRDVVVATNNDVRGDDWM